jgi:hypothetical protein
MNVPVFAPITPTAGASNDQLAEEVIDGVEPFE